MKNTQTQEIETELVGILEKIKFERELQKVFSNEMAGYLGISDKTYMRFERQESDISLKQFLCICKKLKRKPHFFLGGDDAIYFSDCSNSGCNNTYHINNSLDELKKLSHSLQSLLAKNL